MVESASVVKVISVASAGAKVTPLLNVAVAFTPSVSADVSPKVMFPLAVNAPVKVVSPETPRVEDRVVAPVAPNVPPTVVSPVTPSVPPRVEFPVISRVPAASMFPEVVRSPDRARVKTETPEAEADKIF